MLIDEVENHFHKTLVENMISLYKDKTVNKHSATLIFTTHYCEVMDQVGRHTERYITDFLDVIVQKREFPESGISLYYRGLFAGFFL